MSTAAAANSFLFLSLETNDCCRARPHASTPTVAAHPSDHPSPVAASPAAAGSRPPAYRRHPPARPPVRPPRPPPPPACPPVHAQPPPPPPIAAPPVHHLPPFFAASPDVAASPRRPPSPSSSTVVVAEPSKLLGPHARVLVSRNSDGYACAQNNLTGSVRVSQGPRINHLQPEPQD
jgi:hypothetical protein